MIGGELKNDGFKDVKNFRGNVNSKECMTRFISFKSHRLETLRNKNTGRTCETRFRDSTTRCRPHPCNRVKRLTREELKYPSYPSCDPSPSSATRKIERRGMYLKGGTLTWPDLRQPWYDSNRTVRSLSRRRDSHPHSFPILFLPVHHYPSDTGELT